MKTFNEQVEAQQLIFNINAMRTKIGLSPYDFKFLWAKPIDWLRNEQEITIPQYNEAVKQVEK